MPLIEEQRLKSFKESVFFESLTEKEKQTLLGYMSRKYSVKVKDLPEYCMSNLLATEVDELSARELQNLGISPEKIDEFSLDFLNDQIRWAVQGYTLGEIESINIQRQAEDRNRTITLLAVNATINNAQFGITQKPYDSQGVPKPESTGARNDVKVEGKGHTGRTAPNNFNEQMAMNQVKSNPLDGAKEIKSIELGDPRWSANDGWVKMQSIVKNSNGSKTTIHFVYNKEMGLYDDFKFV